MKTYNPLFCFFIPALLAFTAVLPWPVYAETLEQAVRTAVTTHPSVDTAKAESSYAAQQKREAKSGYFPSVSISSEAGRIYGDNATSRGLSVTRGAGYSGLWNGSVSARETIFNGFQTGGRVDSAEARRRSADMSLADTRENLAFKTVQAYIDLMRAREGLALLKTHGKKIDDYVARIKKKVDEGASDEAEYQQSRDINVILDGLVADYQGQVYAAESNYFNLTGHLPDEKLVKPVVPTEMIPKDVDVAMGVARKYYPSLQAAQYTSESAMYDIAVEKGALYPQLDGELSYMAEDKKDIIGGEIEDGRALVRLSWDFDTGGAQLARVRQKKFAQAEALAKIRETERQIELGVHLAWSEYKVALEQLENQRKRRMLNQKLFNTYKVQFEGAKISLLQLMQGDNQLFTTDLEKVNGQYRLLAAEYAILASIGRLQESLRLASAASGFPKK